MPTNISLTKFCVLDKDARKAKFAFRLDHYSNLTKHQMTRSFNFGGSYWKFQVSRNEDYLGMYLRWYGTARPFSKHTNKCTCTASTRFSVINHFFPDTSISEGPSKNADTYHKLGGGIGYSKVVMLHELEKSPGYILNDTLYLQLYLSIIQTTFDNKLSADLQPGLDFVEGLRFPFYGTTWYVILYPDGEPHPVNNQHNTPATKAESPTEMDEESDEEDRKDHTASPKSAGIYLRRETDLSRRSLRHNVQFIISVEGAGECGLDQHFYSSNNNVYGSATFMPSTHLKNMIQSGDLIVTIKFMTIVPYFYYSYGINHRDNSLCEGFLFNDHYKYPWKFKLMKNPSSNKENIQGVMKLDPTRGSRRVKVIKKRGYALQVCWFVEILSPENILKSLTFTSVGKRPVIDSFFTNSGERDIVNFLETTSEVCDVHSPLLDGDGNLSVLVSVLCANLVNKKGAEGNNVLDMSACDDKDT